MPINGAAIVEYSLKTLVMLIDAGFLLATISAFVMAFKMTKEKPETKKEEDTKEEKEPKKVEEPKKIEDAPRAPGRERRIRIAEETARAASTRRDREMIRVPTPGKAAEINKEVRQEPKKETKESGLPEDFDKYIENLRKSSAELLKEFDKMMEIGKNE